LQGERPGAGRSPGSPVETGLPLRGQPRLAAGDLAPATAFPFHPPEG